jgi:hypothetical protein
MGTRLFLKDGGYLLAREYKVEADRVRYYSVERSAWEEIPTALIDWDATRKGEAEDAEWKKQIDEKLAELSRKERFANMDVDASIEVSPGVFLPNEPGMYVVTSAGVASLGQSPTDTRRDKRRLFVQVISPIPVVPSKHHVELKGARAHLRVGEAEPEFYIRTADAHEPAILLVRVQTHGDKRQILEISTNVVGQSTTKQQGIAIERWTTARGVFRYTLGQKLDPGEYAFLQEVPDQGLSLYVWDFGVDAAASAAPKK